MRTVDLNADLAEGTSLSAQDLAVLDTVTSASLACGFHAGDEEVMRATAAACVARGVAIGAHVSFRDRQGFGRRPMEIPPAQLVADIVEQHAVLSGQATAVGGRVAFVKPHGALYNRMGVDPTTARAVVDAVAGLGIPALVAQSGTVVVELARGAGLQVVLEGFPDRGYRSDGLLVSRSEPGALIDDPILVGQRAVSLVRRGGVGTVDGGWTPVDIDTLCVHGDAPDAALVARAVRAALEADGVVLRSFDPPMPTPAMTP